MLSNLLKIFSIIVIIGGHCGLLTAKTESHHAIRTVARDAAPVDLGYFAMGRYERSEEGPLRVRWQMLRAYWEYADDRGAFCTQTELENTVVWDNSTLTDEEIDGSPLFIPKRMDEAYWQALGNDLLSTTPVYETDRCFPDLIGLERLELDGLRVAEMSREEILKLVDELAPILHFKTTYTLFGKEIAFADIPQPVLDFVLEDLDGMLDGIIESGLNDQDWLTAIYVAPEDKPALESFFNSIKSATNLSAIRQAISGEQGAVNPEVVDKGGLFGLGGKPLKLYPPLTYSGYAQYLNKKGVQFSAEERQRYYNWLAPYRNGDGSQEEPLSFQADSAAGNWSSHLGLVFEPIANMPLNIAADYCRSVGLEFPTESVEQRLIEVEALKPNSRLVTLDHPLVLVHGLFESATSENLDQGLMVRRYFPKGIRCIRRG